MLPVDAVVATSKEARESEVVKIENIPSDKSIFDIGPETKAQIGGIIAKAKQLFGMVRLVILKIQPLKEVLILYIIQLLIIPMPYQLLVVEIL